MKILDIEGIIKSKINLEIGNKNQYKKQANLIEK